LPPKVAMLIEQMASKANLSSPEFTGVPKAPTASSGTATIQIATTEFVALAIQGLIGSSPETMATIEAIQAELASDESAAAALTTTVAGKQPVGNYITALTDDVTATGPGSAAATVVGLRGRSLATTTPSDGYVLTWVASTSKWTPVAAASTGASTSAANTWTAQQTFETGTTGQTPLIVRQTGGTPGTHEIQIYYDGTNGVIWPKSGYLNIAAPNGAALIWSGSYRGLQCDTVTLLAGGGIVSANFSQSYGLLLGTARTIAWNSASNLGQFVETIYDATTTSWRVKIPGGVVPNGTSGRIPYETTGGLLTDDPDLTWDSVNNVLSISTGTGYFQTAGAMIIRSNGGITLQYFGQDMVLVNSNTTVIKSPSSNYVALNVRGASGQTANIQEWQNNSSAVKASIGPSGQLSLASILSPANTPTQLSTNTNNYAPSIGIWQRWNASTPINVTGMVAGVDGESRYIRNVGTNTITLTNQDSASTSTANKIALAIYDATTAAWCVTVFP
jgi:hypothetical protein